MAGKRPVADGKRWTREQIIEALVADTRRRGRPPLSSEWDRGTDTHPERTTVRRTFGSWRQALEAAGVAPDPVWPPDEIVERIVEWAEKFGAPPTLMDWNPRLAEIHGYTEIADYWRSMHPYWPDSSTVRYHFGSWNHAIEAAGFVPMQPGVKRSSGSGETGLAWSREDIIAAIRDWHVEHGELPSYRGWQGAGRRWPSTRTVLRIFGSWAAACRAAGVVPRRPGMQRRGREIEYALALSLELTRLAAKAVPQPIFDGRAAIEQLAGTRYIVIGGVADAAHGHVHATTDIDIVTADNSDPGIEGVHHHIRPAYADLLPGAIRVMVHGHEVQVIGRDDLLVMLRQSDRPEDAIRLDRILHGLPTGS